MKSKVSVIVLWSSALICLSQAYTARPSYYGDPAALQDPFEVICRWKQLSFRDPPHAPGDQIAGQDYYIQKNNVPTGFSRHTQSKRIFITIPRRNPGISSSVNFVYEDECLNGSPKLRPYPDYVTNELEADLTPNPARIISVYRPTVDVCNRLWFVDTGILEYPPGNRTVVQNPSIWIFDLRQNRIFRRFTIPDGIYGVEGVGLISLTVDTHAYNCDDAHAYMPNLELKNLLVYSLRRNDIWSFSHPFMQPDTANMNYELDGLKFGFPDGIFSVALSPDINTRVAYFHPLASLQEFSVPSKVLRNKQLSPNKYAPGDFTELGVRGQKSQSAIHDVDQRGVLYYTEIQTNSLKCWNTATPVKPENIGTVYESAETMMYPNDLEIDSIGDIWAMSNRFPIFIYRGLDPEQYNFHIVRGRGDLATLNTVCHPVDRDAIVFED
ncbi:L-dopachrome tautomerase yellow-f-like [Phlebotomus argentipes]|uniref:L-dopachrome tautomerase yellow-f-like n=1 Tax=Phlebotomus argentipes TaxID=94469 RepID=UPI002892B07F|nr:L-dopachrome tautomerase yellow-f-like [Phlebotomus argentipes]